MPTLPAPRRALACAPGCPTSEGATGAPAAGRARSPVSSGAWGGGDRAAADRLFALLYEELRRIAHRALADQRHEATLQTTALVHELYLRLVGSFEPRDDDRRRFFGAAAKVMRRILVDRARERLAEKRGAGERPDALDEDSLARPRLAGGGASVEAAGRRGARRRSGARGARAPRCRVSPSSSSCASSPAARSRSRPRCSASPSAPSSATGRRRARCSPTGWAGRS